MTNLIAESIRGREDKMGSPVPLKEWMRGGSMRDFVRDTILSCRSRERGIFAPAALEKLIDSEAAFALQVWGALCLELWHQRLIDRT